MRNIQIVVDGGCRGNNAHAERSMYGSMAVLCNGKPVDFTYKGGCIVGGYHAQIGPAKGVYSNNVAELEMLCNALLYAHELLSRWKMGKTDVLYIVSDSEVALGWVKGTNKCKAKHLKERVEFAQKAAQGIFSLLQKEGNPNGFMLVNKPREFSVAILGH